MAMKTSGEPPHVVIIGGGFGGLYAARSLARLPVLITLIDRRNFHLFQPLLYQVATGGLSPGDIASPLRAVLRKHRNARVIENEVVDIEPHERKVVLSDGEISYDMLVVATGVDNYYFGNDRWAHYAPALKTIEDALGIRRRILQLLEEAEKEDDRKKREEMTRIVVIGGGPTGVELAGAIAELVHRTMKDDFRNFSPVDTEVILIEGAERILPSYPSDLSQKAVGSLEKLGVTIMTGSYVNDIADKSIELRREDHDIRLKAGAIFWTAGVRATSLGKILADKTGAKLDRQGKVIVQPDMTVPGIPEVFVIGDLANFSHQTGSPLPGVAPVAMQQGRYVGKVIKNRLKGKRTRPFHYLNKGNLAVIGRNAAVADFGFLRFGGIIAWLTWVFVHIAYLIEYDNKLIVLVHWAWNYFTKKQGARLITRIDDE